MRLTASQIIVAGVTALIAGCATGPPAPRTVPVASTTPAALRVQVLEVRPHDTTAFTQGFELAGDVLYESTGLVGQSEMRATDPSTGAVLRRVTVPSPYFAEGMTVVDSKVWQLTWMNGVAFQRDLATFSETKQAAYTGEGWGLCHDTDQAGATRLVMSDGTDRITFRDPETFEQTGEVRVTNGGEPVTNINELECVGENTAYANIWLTDTIVRIDLASGRVTATVDASGLLSPEEGIGADVLNGIAAIPGTDEFLITGKFWPKMFKVRFLPAGR